MVLVYEHKWIVSLQLMSTYLINMQVMLEQKLLGDSLNCKASEMLRYTLLCCGLRHCAAL